MDTIVALCQALSIECLKRVANTNLGMRSKDFGRLVDRERKERYQDGWMDVFVKAGAAYIYKFFGSNSLFDVDLWQLQKDTKHDDTNVWARELKVVCRGYNMYRTSNGYDVLGPHLAREGDLLYVLFGGGGNTILRKKARQPISMINLARA